MYTTANKRNIQTVRQGDPGFILTDGFVQYPRAMVHILPGCPENVRRQIQWAIDNGYLKPVAHVQGKELTWQHLTA
jgi:hypothetical protein